MQTEATMMTVSSASLDLNKRNKTIDAAKGIGILLVFLGHLVPYGCPLFRAIFNFHMPLFFFLSGCFFLPDGGCNMRRYFKRIFVNVVLPIMFFTTLAAIVSIFCPQGEIPHKDTYPYWLIYCVSTWHKGPVFVSNIWFLVCLAGTQSVAWFVWPWSKKSFARAMGLILFCVLVAYGVATLDLHHKFLFPLMSSSIPMALAFFLIGHILRGMLMKLDHLHVSIWIVLFPALALLIEFFFSVVLCSESPNLAIPDFPSWWTFPIASATGIAFALLMGRICQNRLFLFLGRNSLYLFMLEGYASRIVSQLLRFYDPAIEGNPLLAQYSWHYIVFKLVASLLLASIMTIPAKGVLSTLQKRVK